MRDTTHPQLTFLGDKPRSRSSMIVRDAELGFLCFTVDDEEFGVNLNLVVQIVKPPAVTRVPKVGPHVMGVVSIRGMVVTLIDLRLLLGLPASTWPRSARVLIVESNEERVGLLVDAVTQVRRLRESDIERKPMLDESRLSDKVLCVARPREGVQVTVIDLAAILAESLK